MFMTTTFGMPSLITVPPGRRAGRTLIPMQFDERFYALRDGLQDWVTSPSTEIADDLTALRFGVEQRWQTKRGPPDDRHIIDWITLRHARDVLPRRRARRFRQADRAGGLRFRAGTSATG